MDPEARAYSAIKRLGPLRLLYKDPLRRSRCSEVSFTSIFRSPGTDDPAEHRLKGFKIILKLALMQTKFSNFGTL